MIVLFLVEYYMEWGKWLGGLGGAGIVVSNNLKLSSSPSVGLCWSVTNCKYTYALVICCSDGVAQCEVTFLQCPVVSYSWNRVGEGEIFKSPGRRHI